MHILDQSVPCLGADICFAHYNHTKPRKTAIITGIKMAEHPFGNIQTYLTVSWHRSTRFSICRLKLAAVAIKKVRLDKGKVSPLNKFLLDEFAIFRAFNDSPSNPDFQLLVKRIFLTEDILETLRKSGNGFGYRIAVNVPLDSKGSSSWPDVEIYLYDLNGDHLTGKYQVNCSAISNLFYDDLISQFFELLSDYKQLEIEVNLEGIKFTADGTVLHQFTKFKKLLDPERVVPDACKQISSILGLPIVRPSQLNPETSQFLFGSLLEYCGEKYRLLTNLCEQNTQDKHKIEALFEDLKKLVVALEDLFVKPILGRAFVEFIRVSVVQEAFQQIHQSIQESSQNYNSNPPNFATDLVLSIILCRQLSEVNQRDMVDSVWKSSDQNVKSSSSESESLLTVLDVRWLDKVLFKLLERSTYLYPWNKITLAGRAQASTASFLYSLAENSLQYTELHQSEESTKTETYNVELPLPSFSEGISIYHWRHDTIVVLLGGGSNHQAWLCDLAANPRYCNRNPKHSNRCVLQQLPVVSLKKFKSTKTSKYHVFKNGLVALFDSPICKSVNLAILPLRLQSFKQPDEWVYFDSESYQYQLCEPIPVLLGTQNTLWICSSAILKYSPKEAELQINCLQLDRQNGKFDVLCEQRLQLQFYASIPIIFWVENKKRIFLIAAERSFSMVGLYFLQKKQLVQVLTSSGKTPGLDKLRRGSKYSYPLDKQNPGRGLVLQRAAAADNGLTCVHTFSRVWVKF